MKHYLMIKTHVKTGMRYLCKTSTDDPRKPYKYVGSGKYWLRHLKKHGRNIETLIVGIYESKSDLIDNGVRLSEELDVVKSEQFANLIPERGDGGPTMLGRTITKEQSEKKSASLKRFNANTSPEYRERRRLINSKCHEEYIYHTPHGVFTNSYTAANSCGCSNVTVYNRCVKDTNKPIQSKKYWRFGWRNRTWKSLGWWSEPIHAGPCSTVTSAVLD